MKRIALLLGITAITALVAVSVATASTSGVNDWFITQHGAHAGQCVEKPGQGHSNSDFAGPYTDNTCTTLVTNGGGDNGGGGDNSGGGDSSGAPAQLPPPEANVFLCYSSFGNVPGVWPTKEAKTLVADGGYWLAYAVAGNVDGGTNIGGYHLVCNLGGTQSVTPGVVGGAGEVLGSGNNGNFGFYPVVGS
jgi:hypothetical protein